MIRRTWHRFFGHTRPINVVSTTQMNTTATASHVVLPLSVTYHVRGGEPQCECGAAFLHE